MAGIGSLVVRQVNMASQAARARFQVVMPAFEVSAVSAAAWLVAGDPCPWSSPPGGGNDCAGSATAEARSSEEEARRAARAFVLRVGMTSP